MNISSRDVAVHTIYRRSGGGGGVKIENGKLKMEKFRSYSKL